jgi:mannitol-1-phosphate 5-dehydrogenase
VGFVDTVIARMVPPLPPELRAQDPSLIVVEPYQELPVDAAGFAGPPPAIVGMQPVAPFSFYTERKLYLHNAGHAVLGYLGYQRGYMYGYEAMQEAEIAQAVRGAMAESQQALEQKYGLAAGTITPNREDLIARFHNRALGDTNFRLGRDPIRKLAHNDRLIGAALTALEQGVEPVNLVTGIVAALHFDPPEDPPAMQLQEQLRQDGLETVLQKICGLTPDSPLAQRIRSAFT